MLWQWHGFVCCNDMDTSRPDSADRGPVGRSFVVRRGADLGAAVAEVRRTRGLTQAELAERTGIQRSYVASLESGRTNRLIEHLLRTLRRLGAEVTVTWRTASDPADGAAAITETETETETESDGG